MSTEQSRPSVTLLTLTGVLLLVAVVFGGVAMADHAGDGYINGTVTTDSGNADEIQVQIINNSSGTVVEDLTVPEGGSFNRTVAAGHEYDVVMNEKIHEEKTITVSVTQGNTTTFTTNLNATGEGELYGTYQTETSEQGYVAVRNGTGVEIANVSLNSGDQYSIAVPSGEGPYNVTANAASHNRQSVTGISVTTGERIQNDFTLNETLQGHVEGTAELANDQGQNITARLLDSNNNIIAADEVPNGSVFNLTADPDTYTLQLTAPNHQEYTQSVTVQNNSTQQLGTITLQESPPYVSGNITTERNDYSGTITVDIENSSGVQINSTTLSGGGQYNLTLNQTGEFTVFADSPDHTQESQTVQVNNSTDSKSGVDFEMNASSRGLYEIQVFTEDAGGQDIQIRVNEVNRMQTVTEGGSYTFDLPTGDYTATIQEEGYQTQTIAFTVTSNTNGKSQTTLQVANSTINGTVTNDDLSSSQQFTVEIEETGETRTVQNGDSFSFEVEPGTYTVNASGTGLSSESKQVDVTAGETINVSLSPYVGSNISVHLELENTSAASSGTVTVQETGNSYTIDHNNSTQITGLREGSYTLVADATGHLSRTTEVTTTAGSTTQQNFSLPENTGNTGFVAYTVESEDGNATDITVQIVETSQTFNVQESNTRQVELTEGNYTFVANADGYNETQQEVEVTANDTETLTLQLGLAPPDVDAPGVRIVGGNSYWVGQDFWREGLGNYTEVKWSKDIGTGINTTRPIDSDDIYRGSVKDITSELGSNADYTLYGVNSSGNETQIASVFLGVQELNASFSPNESVDRTEANFNSNRGGGYEIIITQDSSDTNQLTTQEIADLFGQNMTTEIRTIDGTQHAVAQVPSGSATVQLNVSDLERANYNFNYEVVDTPAKANASVSLVVAPFEDEADDEITDGGRYWLGQRLEASTNINDGETISVYTDESNFVQEITADEFGVVQLRTGSLGTGEFYFRDSDGNRIMNFSVAEQTITANFTDSEVLNAGSQSESGLTVDSNRAGYDLLISANFTNESGETQALSSSELATAFDANTTTVNGTEYAVIRDISNLQTFILDARNLSAGNYTFEVQAADANASATTKINVTVPVDGQALFTNQFYTHNRGDVAEITIDFSGDSRNTTLILGQYERVGYQLTAEITRETDVGEATLLFNTSAAGQGTPSEALKVKNGTVDLQVVDETNLAGDRKLATARYLMELKVENQTTDLSTLNLFDAGVASGEIYGVPPTVSSVGNSSVVMNKSVPMDEIDSKSYVVVGFKVTGLEIQMNESRRTSSDFDSSSPFAQQAGISVNITKDDTGINEETEVISPANALQYHYVPLNETDEENNTAMALFVFSPSEFNTEGDGEYHASMNISERKNSFVETDMNVTTNFTFVESETKFDRHWSGDILVLPEENQTISGTTTLPPGTNFTHEVRSENVRFPFYRSQEITVTENGTFNASYDLSTVPVGLEFNTTIPSQMENQSVTAVSEIQPKPPEQMSNVTVFTEVDGEPTPANLTLGNNEITTSDSPPRQTLYISKGTYSLQGTIEVNGTNHTIDQQVTIENNSEAFVANFTENGGNIDWGDPRDEPETYTLTVLLKNASATGQNDSVNGLVTLDGGRTVVATNGSATFEVIAGDYTVSGQAHQYTSAQQQVTVSDDRTVTLELQPDKPEPVDTGNNTTNNTSTSRTPGQPGFGVVVALLALLSATLLARRE